MQMLSLIQHLAAAFMAHCLLASCPRVSLPPSENGSGLFLLPAAFDLEEGKGKSID